jgi:hypothetical protein
MKDIDYAALYGVKPGESDFSGAIERSLKNGIKHIDNHLDEYVKMIKKI